MLGLVFAAVVTRVLFFTKFIDRPQLRVRRTASLVALALALASSGAALVLPYEVGAATCEPAFKSYGFRTEALARPSAAGCESAGQMLVIFGWTVPVVIMMVAGLWWYSRD